MEPKSAPDSPRNAQNGAKKYKKGARKKVAKKGSKQEPLFFCDFGARRKKARFLDPLGAKKRIPGAKQNRFGQKGVRARRFVFRSGRKSTGNGEKAELVVLPQREHDIRGPGGSGKGAPGPPESRNRAPGTPQNRSGADSGKSGAAAILAKTPKQGRRGYIREPKMLGYFGPAEAAGLVRRGTLRDRLDFDLPNWIPG